MRLLSIADPEAIDEFTKSLLLLSVCPPDNYHQWEGSLIPSACQCVETNPPFQNEYISVVPQVFMEPRRIHPCWSQSNDGLGIPVTPLLIRSA